LFTPLLPLVVAELATMPLEYPELIFKDFAVLDSVSGFL